jgi:hypothetical protein
MRSFPYITVGKILKELREDGLPLTRVTFGRLEDRLNLNLGKRTSGGWRVYSREQADEVKSRIKKEYNLSEEKSDELVIAPSF